MKKLTLAIIALVFVLKQVPAFAQVSTVTVKDAQSPVNLPVCYYKTTNLIFPYAIKSVDKGSKDILVQKAVGVENVLQVKAGKERFPQTNLTVITADGQLYTFLVDFNPEPRLLNIRLNNPHLDKPVVQFSAANDNEAIIKGTAEIIATKAPFLSGLKAKNEGIRLQLNGLYVKDDLFYFQLEVENRAEINYDVDQLRFAVRDLEVAKRTASQELDLKPLQTLGNARIIRGHSKQTIVIALPKFTIQDRKELVIQLLELQGARNLSLTLKNGQLVRAIAI